MIKTNQKNRIITFLLAFTLAVLQITAPALAADRPTDVKKAGSGNVLVGVPGSFEWVSKVKILNRVNEIRKEACRNGYINPSTGKKLKASDYVPIKWSSGLEWIAQLRAAECTVYEGHIRPNGKSCFSISCKSETSWAECLAWNYSGMMYGIEQWYVEKNDWITRNSSAVTGHYTSLINPNNKFIGMGSFVRDTGGWYGVCAEFGHTAVSQAHSKLKGKTIQTIEIIKKNTKQLKLNAPSSIKLKDSRRLIVTCSVTYPGIMGGQNTTMCRVSKNITWKSSKPSVLSISSSGKITANKTGKATVTAKVKGWKTFKKTITVAK